MTPDTIAALSSPAGASARGIVRLSGPDSLSIITRLAGAPPASEASRSYFACDATLSVKGLRLPVRLYVMRAPASYTREDIVEAHAPGAPALLRAVFEAVLALGARPATPGEFTRRAFLNGRLDLSQAEAVQRVIHARDDAELRTGLRALGGAVSRAAESLRDRIASLCAEVEAALDFSDQDIELIPASRVADTARALAQEARHSAGETRPAGRIASESPRVVLCGPVNAGKSSLFNAFAASPLAIVTPRPGVTRDTIEVEVAWEGQRLVLVDTAGERPAQDEVEAAAIEKARRAGDEADMVLFVVDAAAAFDDAARAAARGIPPERALVALNKCDLAAGAVPADLLPGVEAVRVSALTGEGLDELRRGVVFRLQETVDRSASGIGINARHAAALGRATEALERAAGAAEGALDLAAADLREALDAVGEISGRVLTDDILDRIFATFCIGK
jgi:tRNA modification GTPase